MPVVAVVNRKGGSGKSTLATHLAAHFANRGATVMLADIDRQQSTRTWLRQRKAANPQGSAIIGWSVDPRNFVRPPSSADIVVLDTPGGLTGLDLARVVMYADAILMPVCNSIFDRESAADCLAELRLLPRVVSGRCRIGAVGMRLDARTEAAGTVQTWAAEQRLPLIALLRESAAYVRCIEKGLTLFDAPAAEVEDDLAQWKPILQWLRPVLESPANDPAPTRHEISAARAASMETPPAALARRPAAPVFARAPRTLEPTSRGAVASPANSMSRLLGTLPIPRFLQRTP
jgi:chromosome partitioning protein